MSESRSVSRTVDLPGGSVVPFCPAFGERVRILSGRVWLTEEGSMHDAFLASGEEVALGGGGGLAVIEALGPARIQLLQDRPVSLRLARSVAALTRRSLATLRRGRVRLPWLPRGAA